MLKTKWIVKSVALVLAFLFVFENAANVFAAISEEERYLNETDPVTLEQQFKDGSISEHVPAAQLYVKDLMLSNRKNATDAKADLHAAGYIAFDADLNPRSDSGRWVYLGYKLTIDRSQAITDIKVMNEKGGYQDFDYREEARKNYDGLPSTVSGLMKSCTELRERYQAGKKSAKLAVEYLNGLCVPETSKGKTGEGFGNYLISQSRTYQDYEDLILILTSLVQTYMNNYISLGLSDYENPHYEDAYTEYEANPTWLTDAVNAMPTSTMSSHYSTIKDEGDSYWMEQDGYYLEMAQTIRDEVTSNQVKDASVKYLKETNINISSIATQYIGTDFPTLYSLLTDAPLRFLYPFIAAMPKMVRRGDFARILNDFVADPEKRLPSKIERMEVADSVWMNQAVKNIQTSVLDPEDPDDLAIITEMAAPYKADIELVSREINGYIADYRKAKANIEANGNYVGEDEIFDEDSDINTVTDEEKQILRDNQMSEEQKNADALNVSAYDVVNAYRIDKNQTLGSYIEKIADTYNAEDNSISNAYTYFLFVALTPGQAYSLKSTGVTSFFINGLMCDGSLNDLENKKEEILDSLKTEEGNPCSIWIGTNKDMLETERLAMTSKQFREADAKHGYDSVFEPNDTTFSDKMEKAMTVAGLASGVAMLVYMVAVPVLSYFFGVTSITSITTIALGVGISAAGVSAQMAVACICLTVINIVGWLLLAAMVIFLIVWLVSIFKKKRPTPNFDEVPTIMLELIEKKDPNTGDVNPYTVKYEVIRTNDGKAADTIGFGGQNWNALYYTRDSRAGSPLVVKNGVCFFTTLGKISDRKDIVAVKKFGNDTAYNLNTGAWEDGVNGIYLYYYTENSIKGMSDVEDYDMGKYIYQIILGVGKSQKVAKDYILSQRNTFIVDVNLSPDSDYYTYIGFSTTDNPDEAITDIRVATNTTTRSINYGNVRDAYQSVIDDGMRTSPLKTCEPAASDRVSTDFYYSLYTSKKSELGDPILAGSLKVYNEAKPKIENYEEFISPIGTEQPHNFNFWNNIGKDVHPMYITFKQASSYETTGGKYIAGFTLWEGSSETSKSTGSKTNISSNWYAKEGLENYLIMFPQYFSGDTANGSDMMIKASTSKLARVMSGSTTAANFEEEVEVAIGISLTSNPKRAITEIGIFRGEPGSDTLANEISRDGMGFVACTVLNQKNSYNRKNGGWPETSKQLNYSHAYISSSTNDLAFNDFGKNYRATGLYVAGPTTGANPLTLDDILFASNSYEIPDGDNNNGLAKLSFDGSKISLTKCNGAVTGTWKTVHELENYFYDEYDANGYLTTPAVSLGEKGKSKYSSVVSDGSISNEAFIYYRNGKDPITRGKYIKSINAVSGYTKPDGGKNYSIDYARYNGMSLGQELINADSLFYLNAKGDIKISDYDTLYDKAAVGYDCAAVMFAVSYTDSQTEALSSIYVSLLDNKGLSSSELSDSTKNGGQNSPRTISIPLDEAEQKRAFAEVQNTEKDIIDDYVSNEPYKTGIINEKVMIAASEAVENGSGYFDVKRTNIATINNKETNDANWQGITLYTSKNARVSNAICRVSVVENDVDKHFENYSEQADKARPTWFVPMLDGDPFAANSNINGQIITKRLKCYGYSRNKYISDIAVMTFDVKKDAKIADFTNESLINYAKSVMNKYGFYEVVPYDLYFKFNEELHKDDVAASYTFIGIKRTASAQDAIKDIRIINIDPEEREKYFPEDSDYAKTRKAMQYLYSGDRAKAEQVIADASQENIIWDPTINMYRLNYYQLYCGQYMYELYAQMPFYINEQIVSMYDRTYKVVAELNSTFDNPEKISVLCYTKGNADDNKSKKTYANYAIQELGIRKESEFFCTSSDTDISSYTANASHLTVLDFDGKIADISGCKKEEIKIKFQGCGGSSKEETTTAAPVPVVASSDAPIITLFFTNNKSLYLEGTATEAEPSITGSLFANGGLIPILIAGGIAVLMGGAGVGYRFYTKKKDKNNVA